MQAISRSSSSSRLPVVLLRPSDPILRVVTVEDAAAVIGTGPAAGGLALGSLLGSHVPDASASMVIE